MTYLFLLTSIVYAASSLLVEIPPVHVLLNQGFTFHPKPGYHFNQKAPQNCGAKPAENLTLQSLDCQFGISGAQNVSLKICDEKETFWKNEDFRVEVPGQTVVTGGPSEAPTRPLVEGFTADVEKAKTEARAGKKILFIDFSASWCPPCNVMEETITSTKPFRDATAGFVRVYQDIDLRTSFPLMTRFNINSFPTYVVTDQNLTEIGRIHEVSSFAIFSKWLHLQESRRASPLNAINPKTASPEERLRLGKELLLQENYPFALTAVDGLNTRPAEYIAMQAKVRLAQAEPDKLKQLLPEAIMKFDDEPAVVDWTDAWLKLVPDKAKVVATVEKIIEKLKSSQDVLDEGITEADLYYQFGWAVEPVDAKESTKLFSKAADAFAAIAKKSGEKNSRGYGLTRMTALYHGGRFKEAVALGTRLTRVYPKDYVFNRSLAYIYEKQKKYPQALREVNEALKKTYGDVWFELAEHNGKILLDMGKKSDARRVAEDALSKLELPENRNLGPHYYAASLQKLLRDSSTN